MSSAPKPGPNGPIVSDFASDPEMGELVQLFVSELPQRVESLRDAWAHSQIDMLLRLAHQLRGASAGYGFPTIGRAAERLETDPRRVGAAGATPDLESIAAQFRDLVDLCNRVRAGA